MSKAPPPYDDEIDLFAIFKTLKDGRRRIFKTIFVSVLFGISLYFVLPNSHTASTPVNMAKQSVLIQYTAINELLEKIYEPNKDSLEFKKKQISSLFIDPENIFKLFVVEFNDYNEIIDVLSKNEYVKQKLDGLDKFDKQKEMVELAKSFILKPPSKKEVNWYLLFEWHDDTEGLQLLNDAIKQMLINVQISVKNNLDRIATSIDIRNKLKIEDLQNYLITLKMKQIYTKKKELIFLKEQSAIAKALKIESNSLDTNNLTKSSQPGISLSVNSTDIPYYLRGYKSIDKEITLLENRTEEESMFLMEGYIDTLEEIDVINADTSSTQLRTTSSLLSNANTNDWIEFDLQLNEGKAGQNLALNIILSMALGGLIGALLVLTSDAIRKRKRVK